MIVRRRTEEDLLACVRIMATTHSADGYPVRWPADPAGWLTPPGMAAAWVATPDGTPDEILGHVCVVEGIDDPIVAAATGIPSARRASVARLFVAEAARGHRLAAVLLDEVATWTAGRNLELMLDVLDDAVAAIALYERLGWQMVDRRLTSWVGPDGHPRWLRIYIVPSRTPNYD